MATPRRYVEAPAVAPRPFGLFSAAQLPNEADGPETLRMLLGGVQYEPDSCGVPYVTDGACPPATSLGTASVNVDNARVATLTVTGEPEGLYSIEWGDESDPVATTDPDGATHTYGADGTYVLNLIGPGGYVAQVVVVVANGVDADPVDADVSTNQLLATDGISVVESGAPFVVYNLFRCRMPAGGVQQGLARAQAALRLGEQRAVERVFAHQLATHPDAVDLTPTPGTAVHIVDAVARLEEWSGARYGGVPVIHSPLGMVVRLGATGLVERQGARLETKLGSPVAAGAGYGEGVLAGPSGAPAPDTGEAYLWVTGQVVVRRTPNIEVPVTPELTDSHNQFLAVAQRPYVITTECIVGAILAKTPYGVPV